MTKTNNTFLLPFVFASFFGLGCDPEPCTSTSHDVIVENFEENNFRGLTLNSNFYVASSGDLVSVPDSAPATIFFPISLNQGDAIKRTIQASIKSSGTLMTEPVNNSCPSGHDYVNKTGTCVPRELRFVLRAGTLQVASAPIIKTTIPLTTEVPETSISPRETSLLVLWQATGALQLSARWNAKITINECK